MQVSQIERARIAPDRSLLLHEVAGRAQHQKIRVHLAVERHFHESRARGLAVPQFRLLRAPRADAVAERPLRRHRATSEPLARGERLELGQNNGERGAAGQTQQRGRYRLPRPGQHQHDVFHAQGPLQSEI